MLTELKVIDCPEYTEEFKELMSRGGILELRTSPQAAKMILDNFNNTNRDQKLYHREYFKNLILNDKFIENSGETITFCNNELKNFQHRLAGQVDADATLTHTFKFGIDPRATDIIDTGLKRHLNDKMSIKAKETNNLNAIMSTKQAKVFKSLINGNNPARIGQLSTDEMFTLWSKDKYRDAINFAIKNLDSKHSSLGIGSAGQVAVIARAYFLNLNNAKLETFCTLLKAGNATNDCPVYALFKKLVNSKRKSSINGGRLTEIEKYKYTEIALTRYIDNEKVKSLNLGGWEDKLNINKFVEVDKIQ